MSLEDEHDYAQAPAQIQISPHELAQLRQSLYEAKLALSASSPKDSIKHITHALDLTQDWTLRV